MAWDAAAWDAGKPRRQAMEAVVVAVSLMAERQNHGDSRGPMSRLGLARRFSARVMGPHVLGKRGSMGRPEPLQAAGQSAKIDPSLCADTLSSSPPAMHLKTRALTSNPAPLTSKRRSSCFNSVLAFCLHLRRVRGFRRSITLLAVYITRYMYYLLRTYSVSLSRARYCRLGRSRSRAAPKEINSGCVLSAADPRISISGSRRAMR